MEVTTMQAYKHRRVQMLSRHRYIHRISKAEYTGEGGRVIDLNSFKSSSR